MKLELKVIRTPIIRFECVICGCQTNKDSTQIAAFDEHGDEEGKVCNACLVSPEALVARAHAHADRLRAYADALMTVVESSIPWPPPAKPVTSEAWDVA